MCVGKIAVKLAVFALCGAVIASLSACGSAAPPFPILKIERITAIGPPADPGIFRITLTPADLAKLTSDPQAFYKPHDCGAEDGHSVQITDFAPEAGGAPGSLLLRIPLNYDRDKFFRCGTFHTSDGGSSAEVHPPGPWPGPLDKAPAKSPP